MKVVGLTTTIRPSERVLAVTKDFLRLLPGSLFLRRKRFKLRQIICFLKLRGIETLLVFREKNKHPSDIWQVSITNKISVRYKLLSFLRGKNFQNPRAFVYYRPEVILKNFAGRTGRAVAFLIGSLFPSSPDFKGRRAVSFCYKRGLIFCRSYRYAFSFSGRDVKLQELGPRFSLRFSRLLWEHFLPV